MEQINWTEEEDESVIRKSIFLGIGFGSDIVKSKKIVKEMGAEKISKEKKNRWNIRMLAEKLRHFADNFEAEFENACATIQPHRDKSDPSHFLGVIKYITDIVKGPLSDAV
uniref:Uncharacterized protein n=1 Tax=Setaria digitata TaxID=48799 RepID=A0A915Q4J8_9BILA